MSVKEGSRWPVWPMHKKAPRFLCLHKRPPANNARLLLAVDWACAYGVLITLMSKAVDWASLTNLCRLMQARSSL